MAKSKIIMKLAWQGFVIISYHPFPLYQAILQYLICFISSEQDVERLRHVLSVVNG